ncbi:F420-dependent glucose-6-phosphate dehydrogenase [Streptomyces tendae]
MSGATAGVRWGGPRCDPVVAVGAMPTGRYGQEGSGRVCMGRRPRTKGRPCASPSRSSSPTRRSPRSGWPGSWNSGGSPAVPARAHAHPRRAHHPLPGRRRAAPRVRPHPRPLRGARPGRGRHRTARLGTGITLAAQHDPIDLAKQIATLDHLSGGRFTLGVGFGWNVEEAADHGVEWRTRRALVRDRIGLMRALWADEPTPYDGEFGAVRASVAYPKPVQKPRGPAPARAPWSAGRPDRSCSPTSAPTPTAGCRSAGAA